MDSRNERSGLHGSGASCLQDHLLEKAASPGRLCAIREKLLVRQGRAFMKQAEGRKKKKTGHHNATETTLDACKKEKRRADRHQKTARKVKAASLGPWGWGHPERRTLKPEHSHTFPPAPSAAQGRDVLQAYLEDRGVQQRDGTAATQRE